MSKLNLFFCFFIIFISLQSLAETDKPEQIIFIKSLSTQENGSHNCTIGQDQVIWMGTSDHLFVNSNNKADNPLLVEGIKQTHIKNIYVFFITLLILLNISSLAGLLFTVI